MSSALSIRQLTKTYGNGFQALKGIDLDVAEGDFFALLGPNGAGKSTTIRVLLGLLRASSGTAGCGRARDALKPRARWPSARAPGSHSRALPSAGKEAARGAQRGSSAMMRSCS